MGNEVLIVSHQPHSLLMFSGFQYNLRHSSNEQELSTENKNILESLECSVSKRPCGKYKLILFQQ